MAVDGIKRRIWRFAMAATPFPVFARARDSGYWQRHSATRLVSVAKRLNLGVPIQVMPIDWAQSDGECRDRQARNGRFFGAVRSCAPFVSLGRAEPWPL